LIGDQIEIDFCHTNPDGIPHVSLASNIIQLFGASSVPVIVAGSVLGVFELSERFASQRAKDALLKWLLSGERHFSLKCFGRSAAFSLGDSTFKRPRLSPDGTQELFERIFAIALISILCLLISPQVFISSILITLALPLWLMWSIVVDYISLFKTRVIAIILVSVEVSRISTAT
jgi:hypothetical protein